jgi:acetyl esterase/lipase
MTTKRSSGASLERVALRPACLAFSLFLAAPSVEANENKTVSSPTGGERIAARAEKRERHAHLQPESSLADLLKHPAFAGYARLLLPWDDRAYDKNMRISEIGSLLPYHSNVDPDVVVSALNRMIDADNTIFYDLYTSEQKQAEPARANTGLFFFRGRPGAPFAIVAPGGGFSYLGSVHEGFPYAAEINKAGYNVFVLKYRVGFGGRTATEDMAAAISYIFQNAVALRVGTHGYSLWGSSAGARMAATIGSHGVAAFGGRDLPKPSVIVMAYTGHSDTSRDEPPTFVVVGERDGIAPPSTMEKRVTILRNAGVEVEYRKYKDVGHGFGVGSNTSAGGWVTEAVRFWEKFIDASKR